MTDRSSNTGELGGDRLFRQMDETEQKYAPEGVPGSRIPSTEIDAGGTAGSNTAFANEPPAAAPVAHVGSTPTGSAAPPNIGHDEHGGAPGDPETEADYPIGDDHSRHEGEPRSS